jgi:hypothetical protein
LTTLYSNNSSSAFYFFNRKLLQSFVPVPVSSYQIMQYRQKYLEVTSLWWANHLKFIPGGLLPKLGLFA